MPCTDGGEYPSKLSISEVEELKGRLDLATRVACEVLRKLPPKSRRRLSKEACDWRDKHLQEDLRRRVQEKMRAARLKKALQDSVTAFNDGNFDDVVSILQKALATKL